MPDMPRERPKLNLSFPAGGKVQPKGFKDLSVKEEFTVIIKGKILSVSENAEEWIPGKQITGLISSCSFQGPEEGITMDAALSAAQRKV